MYSSTHFLTYKRLCDHHLEQNRTFPTSRKAPSCPLPTKAITVLGHLLLFKRKRNSRGMYIRCLGKQEVIREPKRESMGLESQAVRPSRSQLGRSPTCSGGWIPACWVPCLLLEYNLDEQACYRAGEQTKKTRPLSKHN